jgi:hypothetical protein
MKTLTKILTISFLLGAGIWLMPQTARAHGGGITFQFFYDDLRPYGNWVNTPEYGYVWVPDVESGFQPYSTSGYWVYTGYGWTWVSDYPWGWAPFHYGRWYYDNWYGWVWVPGNEWGPGWVTWRQCDGYYGWAPMTPGFNVTVSFNVNFYIPVNYWVFVPFRHFGRPDIGHYYMHRSDNDRLYRRSDYIVNTGTDHNTNTRYYSGPALSDVRKATGRDIRPVEVQPSERPGQNLRGGKMEVYRPKVERSAITEAPRPGSDRVKPSVSGERRNDVTTRNEKPGNVRPNPVTPAPRQYQDNGKNERQALPPQRQYQGNDRNERQPAPPVKQQVRGNERSKPQVQSAPRQNPGNGSSDRQAKPVERKNPAPVRETNKSRTPELSQQNRNPVGNPHHK